MGKENFKQSPKKNRDGSQIFAEKIKNNKAARDNSYKKEDGKEKKGGIFYPFIITFGITTTVLTLGAIAWWSDKGYQPLSFVYTDMLSETSYAGGSDKMGHLFVSYLGMRITTSFYQLTSLSHKKSVYLAGVFLFFLSTSIELIDGFTEYGFEWEDAFFNSIGIFFGAMGELYPNLDKFIGIRLGYNPSRPYLKSSKGGGVLKTYIGIINDYTGMTFYFDFKFSGLKSVYKLNTYGLQYFLTGINWSTEGYSPGEEKKERYLGVHLGLNLSEVLRQVFNNKNIFYKTIKAIDKYYVFGLTVVNFKYGLNHNRKKIDFGINSYLSLMY